MESKLVSVVTITWNRGNLIGRCIKSVLGQTYQNIEHIIIDGASDDNTEEVVNSFNDKRIRYIKSDKRIPVVDAYNYGIELATGDYITFLDSDDEYLLDKIQKQVTFIETLPIEYGMVYCWMSYFDQQSGKHLYDHATKLRGDASLEAAAKYTVSGTPTFLFRQNVLRELGGWRERGLTTDWELGARYCARWKVDYVPESLVNVYVNHGSQRISDSGFYKDLHKKTVIFHEYMLDEFKDVFKKCPRKAVYHYFMLTNSSAWVKDRKRTRKYFFKHLACLPNPKDFLITLKSLVIGRG